MDKSLWYWECPDCGNIQPAHPNTTQEQMFPCDKWVKKTCYPISYGVCGAKLVKKKGLEDVSDV